MTVARIRCFFMNEMSEKKNPQNNFSSKNLCIETQDMTPTFS